MHLHARRMDRRSTDTGPESRQCTCRFERAFKELVSSREAQAGKVRKDNASLDDEAAKAVQGVSGELAGIAQAVRVKRDLFQANERRLANLQAEVPPETARSADS